MFTSGIKRDVRDISSELIILAAGAATSILTAVVNLIVARAFNFNFLSVSHWFVVPTGALCGGMAAASGYYLGAVWTHTMPSKKFLLEMAAIGASTWFLALWLEYATLTLDDGRTASDLVTFWQYFQVQAEHMTLKIGSGSGGADTGELGQLGYVREALQLLGFIAGGAVVWSYLKDREACEACRKYARTNTLLSAESPDRFQAVMDKAELSFPSLVEDAKRLLGNQPLLGLDLVLAECPSCHRRWARPAVVMGNANSPTRSKLSRYSIASEDAVSLEGSARALPKVKK